MTTIILERNPADDVSVDDDFSVIIDGTVSDYSIQDAPYMGKAARYGVNLWCEAEETMHHLGQFPTIAAATERVRKHIKDAAQ